MSQLWSILSISTKNQQYFEHHPEAFKQFISHLVDSKKDNNLVLYQGKYLEVHTHTIQNEFVGVIIDRTREEIVAKKLKDSLNIEKRKQQQDDLTGLLTRSALQQAVDKSLKKQSKGTMFLFDLDHFKNINDALGHPEGDQVLISFVNFLNDVFRKSDFIGRLGGDEFVVFIPGQITHAALTSKLHQIMIQTQLLFKRYQSYHLSVSIGVSLVNPQTHILNYDHLYKSADTALYIAKRKGKNQFYINDEGIQCMVKTCHYCRQKCPRRDILGLAQQRRKEKDV